MTRVMKYGDERKSICSSVLHASGNSTGPEMFSRETVHIPVGTLLRHTLTSPIRTSQRRKSCSGKPIQSPQLIAARRCTQRNRALCVRLALPNCLPVLNAWHND